MVVVVDVLLGLLRRLGLGLGRLTVTFSFSSFGAGVVDLRETIHSSIKRNYKYKQYLMPGRLKTISLFLVLASFSGLEVILVLVLALIGLEVGDTKLSSVML